MNTKTKDLLLRVAVAVSFLAMVAVNALAQLLPINGVTPGQVSDALPNLFAPAGLTFSIWSVIYLTLTIFTVWQFGAGKNMGEATVLDRTRVLFIVSSLINVAWIFAWHYGSFPLSMLLMLLLLTSLILINLTLDKSRLTGLGRTIAHLPFSLYFGWITVATVANATALLVHLKWNAFGLSEQLWAVAIILAAMLIGTLTMIKRKDIAYGLVLIWAYIGILIKHTSASTFAGAYPAVIWTVVACLVIYAAAEVYLIIEMVKNRSKRIA